MSSNTKFRNMDAGDQVIHIVFLAFIIFAVGMLLIASVLFFHGLFA